MRGELERLRWGPEPGQTLGGIGSVRIIAHCLGNSNRVLAKAREVLEITCAEPDPNMNDIPEWWRRLPRWFVVQFAPDDPDENARYLLLPFEERMKPEHNKWTLPAWLGWFRPENRSWRWWDAAVLDVNTLVIAIEVAG